MAQLSVYSLHKITSDEPSTLSFSPKEYSRFKFGDDRISHRFGIELAKAFTANVLGLIQDSSTEFSVAVSYEYTPSAAYGLRSHFVSYLNRYLVSHKCNPAHKVDIYRSMSYTVDYATQDATTRARLMNKARFQIDRERVAGQTIIVLDDMRVTGSHEERIKRMLREANLVNRVFFVYFAEVTNHSISPTIEHRLNSAGVSSFKEIEALAQSGKFCMNNRVVKDVMSREHVEFCQFLRRQDDDFAHLLLDCVIGSRYYDRVEYRENFKFLLWEVKARESII
ncbi:PRTase ComF-like protein [Massariosphaeria phaeospora]|uniref:PRTase ComF-like protein n=1 Tax=Massariosphaeria phaeospora TaxID=100035 RepID=A0A7C8IEB7_9PLEO|nr:PRTase ComF-like protein [Massariosphaeria phaeospora]